MAIRWRESGKEKENPVVIKKDELPIKPWWENQEQVKEETLSIMEVTEKPDSRQKLLRWKMRAQVKKNEKLGRKRLVEAKSLPKISLPKVKVEKSVRVKKERTEIINGAEHRRRKMLENGLFGVAALLLVVGLVTYVPAMVSVNANAKEKGFPIFAVDTKEPKVALTFNATGKHDDVEGILELLEKHDVKATFFVSGVWLDKSPETVQLICDRGHEIGSLGQNHVAMGKLDAKVVEEELLVLHSKVTQLAGMEMKLFRPPYGEYNDNLIKTVKAAGYFPIMWDVDSLDWKDYGVESIVETIVKHKNLDNGSIVLLHVDAKYTATALESVILNLKEKNYELVTVSDLMDLGDYSLEKQISK